MAIQMFGVGVMIIFVAVLAMPIAGALGGGIVTATTPTVVEVLTVDGMILPEMAEFVDRGITEAERKGATVCIIELNTPGGLLDSTARIVERIMNAEVPVVVYVSPAGAWAASAGTFITLSAHIAAMAQVTTIGAATPVVPSDMPEDERQKIVEFTAKWIETIAEERGRNIEAARLTVTKGESFTDTEALGHDLVDLQAEDLDCLLRQISGWKVTLSDDREVVIDTTACAISRFEETPSGCFIATAAYGRPMADEIQVLRQFRDEYLMHNPLGRTFVDFYYKVSPIVAETITEHSILKPAVRIGLMPAVAMSTVVVNPTAAEKTAVVGLLVLLSGTLVVWATRRGCRATRYA